MRELVARAYDQAQKFGAKILIARKVARLDCSTKPYRVQCSEATGDPLLTRAIIIASGVEYRRLAVENLSRFDGAGVYYAATRMEAQLCADEEIAVVGGANSAGQAAMFLAETAKRVHMLIRGDGLAQTMSRYLISRIEAHPAIELHTRTEIVGLEGNGHLEQIAWRTGRGGAVEIRRLYDKWFATRELTLPTGIGERLQRVAGRVPGARCEGIHQDGRGADRR